VVRYFPVFRVWSLFLMIFGATMLLPLALSWRLDDGALPTFASGMALTFGAGLILWLATREFRRELSTRDGFLMISLVWAGLPAFAALPLLFELPIDPFDAYFEAVSGLTASGATVLSGLDALPPSINFWRTQMVWMGGMGLIVLAVAILPLLGIGGRQMFKSEVPGPMKDSKLTPRMGETAKGLWGIYAAITVACALAYALAGMAPLDAVMHAFSTVALGGFSSHDASFAYWDSPLLEAIAIFFMVVSSINYAAHFLALSGRSLRPYRRDPEARYVLLVLAVSVLGIAALLRYEEVYASFLEALRYAAFNVVSVATTTGFANIDYAQWPFFAPLWMLFLCSFLTSAGSTGGGIKMMRALILYKQVYRELVRALHPSVVYPVKIGGMTTSDPVLFAVLGFAFMYMASITSMTLLLSFTGLDIITAFSAVAASINNTGPGLGQVGPSGNFSALSPFQTSVCTFAMLLGRLEIFALLVVLTPAFWRK